MVDYNSVRIDSFTDTRPWSKTAIWGFVIAFIAPIAGIIVSVLGLKNTKTGVLRGRRLATWGLWLGIGFAITRVLATIAFITLFAFVGDVFSSLAEAAEL